MFPLGLIKKIGALNLLLPRLYLLSFVFLFCSAELYAEGQQPTEDETAKPQYPEIHNLDAANKMSIRAVSKDGKRVVISIKGLDAIPKIGDELFVIGGEQNNRVIGKIEVSKISSKMIYIIAIVLELDELTNANSLKGMYAYRSREIVSAMPGKNHLFKLQLGLSQELLSSVDVLVGRETESEVLAYSASLEVFPLDRDDFLRWFGLGFEHKLLEENSTEIIFGRESQEFFFKGLGQRFRLIYQHQLKFTAVEHLGVSFGLHDERTEKIKVQNEQGQEVYSFEVIVSGFSLDAFVLLKPLNYTRVRLELSFPLKKAYELKEPGIESKSGNFTRFDKTLSFSLVYPDKGGSSSLLNYSLTANITHREDTIEGKEVLSDEIQKKTSGVFYGLSFGLSYSP